MHIFSGVVDIPAPSADNKRGGKPTSSPGLFPICRKKSWRRGWRETPLAPDRVTFVIATIIYSSSPPLFLAPRFWEPRDKPQPGFFFEARERTLGTRSRSPILSSRKLKNYFLIDISPLSTFCFLPPTYIFPRFLPPILAHPHSVPLPSLYYLFSILIVAEISSSSFTQLILWIAFTNSFCKCYELGTLHIFNIMHWKSEIVYLILKSLHLFPLLGNIWKLFF